MKTMIVSKLSADEAAFKLSEAIMNYYLGVSMDQSIGFDLDGDVDYAFNVDGATNIAVEIYNTSGGWCLGDFDYENPGEWTPTVLQEVGDLLLSDWMPENEDYEMIFRS